MDIYVQEKCLSTTTSTYKITCHGPTVRSERDRKTHGIKGTSGQSSSPLEYLEILEMRDEVDRLHKFGRAS